MSDKREALEALAWICDKASDIADGYEVFEREGIIRASLEQKAEPVCRIVFNGNQYGIQNMNGNAFDMSKWPNTTLYTTPPSTAEVEALRRDAERYRWLKDEDNWGCDNPSGEQDESLWGDLGELHGDAFDEFVDQRIREENNG